MRFDYDARNSRSDETADPRTTAIADLLDTTWAVVPTFGEDNPKTATWHVLSDCPSVLIAQKMPKAIADHIADLHNAYLLGNDNG